MTIEIKRGTNISHWLSQSKKRGDSRRNWFTEADVRRIAAWGFDHIRLPIDEEQMWAEQGQPEAEAFDLLDAALDWCAQAGLNVVVDLHILRSHYFNQQGQPALFTEETEVRKFIGFWRDLSDRLHSRPLTRVAYELMNEPVAEKASDWNRVALRAFRALRELEPERTLLLGSNRWNSVDTFDELSVPEDANTYLTFHYYRPMLISHHTAPWWRGGGEYSGPVSYPGLPVSETDLAKLEEPLRTIVANHNVPYDSETMLRDLEKPLALSEKSGCPLYCGEFGVYKKAPAAVREAWYRDVLRMFENRNISWANWDYKGDFGLVDTSGSPTDIAELFRR